MFVPTAVFSCLRDYFRSNKKILFHALLRFVSEAKSVYGYNSLAAGKVVKGKSADELGAKYTPPDISLYKAKEEKEDVGKLEITEQKPAEEELPEGEFPGLPALEELMSKEPKKLRDWDVKYNLPPKLIKNYSWRDGDMTDLYKACDESLNGSGREVGRLQLKKDDRFNDNLTGQYAMRKKEHTKDNSDDCWKLALDSSWQLSEQGPSETANGSTSSINENRPLAPEICNARDTNDESIEKWHEKKRCRYLALLLLLIPIVVLAALLGTRDDGGESKEAAAAAIAFVVPTNSTDVPSSMPSNFTSATPSFSPSVQCLNGLIELSLDHSISISKDKHNSTWEVLDACTGQVISKCLPCSLGTLVLGNKNGRKMQMEVLQPSSECLSREKEYIFHVYSTNDPDSCCGFDASSVSISYGNEVYTIPDEILMQSSLDYTKHFGESEIPCSSDNPSSSPSIWPTFKLTDDPSKHPTSKPSAPPTQAPSTSKPTFAFVGGCPEKFEPLSYYPIGVQVENNGIVYECIDYSCGSFGFEPGKEGSTLWQQGWIVIGECDGTLPPTPRPSTSPTSPYPTPWPTPRPTVTSTTCSIKSGFNLCIALDHSGSVCNFGVGECLFCEPSLFCTNLFSFLPKQQCCQNYIDMIQFSKLMVLALDQFEADRSFSIVNFSTSAQLFNGLSSADETIDALDKMQFTGGSTDHADAIRQCQSSFAMSPDPNRQNFIMMITDGLPSTTYLYPEIAAEEEASNAKLQGTFVIPVFIRESYDTYAENFMTSLSSDGQVYDVTGFQSLDTLKDELVETVLCSG